MGCTHGWDPVTTMRFNCFSFVDSMIDEWKTTKWFHDTMVIPIEWIFTGNRRINKFELKLEIFVVQSEQLAWDGKRHYVAVDGAFAEAVYDIAVDENTHEIAFSFRSNDWFRCFDFEYNGG